MYREECGEYGYRCMAVKGQETPAKKANCFSYNLFTCQWLKLLFINITDNSGKAWGKKINFCTQHRNIC